MEYIHMPLAFICNNNLTMNEKMLYMYLKGAKRYDVMTQSLIAKELKTSSSTIETTVRSLENKNGVYSIKRFDVETGQRITNGYYLADVDPDTGEFVDGSLDKYKLKYPEKIAHVERERRPSPRSRNINRFLMSR